MRWSKGSIGWRGSREENVQENEMDWLVSVVEELQGTSVDV